MCGFAGLLEMHDGQSSWRILSKMTNTLKHRGPDAEGAWHGDGLFLGHRRLSILDLSEAGAQPMRSACGRYVIAFNGEIYNHLDLRQKLETAGAAPDWQGHSDTETLLAGIVHWGLETTLQHAGGMFALAVWDRAAKALFLARDRMGEKPLYWGWAGETLVFGSELKALRQHPECPKGICRNAFAQYLSYAYVPAPRSIHPGIYKLEPGTLLKVEGQLPSTPPHSPLRPGDHYGPVSIKRYWSLDDMLEKGHSSGFVEESEALKLANTTLSAAVGRQMISDVPLGAFLSGGIDSSLVVALMQSQTSRPVQTFTVGFETTTYDEAPHAAAVARHLGTDHTELTVTEREAQDVIPLLPDLYDEPFADSSQIPTYLVCRAARYHVTVALSGDAGDELFGGYNRYVIGPKIWRRLEGMPKPLRRGLGYILSTTPFHMWNWLGRHAKGPFAVSHPGDKAQKLARALQTVESIDDLYQDLVASWPSDAVLKHPQVIPASSLDDDLPGFLENDPAARMMVRDMRSYLPDDILCKVDRAAMGVSLETRVPFLDPAVIELSARVPTSQKIRDGQGKWILRQLLYQHVPQDLIERPKAGFAIPVGDWLRGPLRKWAEDLLDPEALATDDLLDPVPIRKAWQEHLSGRRDWTQKLWVILMFQAWRARWT